MYIERKLTHGLFFKGLGGQFIEESLPAVLVLLLLEVVIILKDE